MSFSLGIDDDITKLVEFDIIAIATTLSLAQVVAIAITFYISSQWKFLSATLIIQHGGCS
jgi:hypothetical protein